MIHTRYDDIPPEEVGQLGEMAAVVSLGSLLCSAAVEDLVRDVSLALIIGGVLKDGKKEVLVALRGMLANRKGGTIDESIESERRHGERVFVICFDATHTGYI